MVSVVVGLFFADPALDADLAVHGQGFREAVIDIFTQGVQRHATFALPFTPGDVRAAEAARALDPNAFGAQSHRHFHGFLHGAAESDAALELKRDVLGHERSLDLGLLHLLNVEENFFAVSFASSSLIFSISWPLRPMTMPGRAV